MMVLLRLMLLVIKQSVMILFAISGEMCEFSASYCCQIEDIEFYAVIKFVHFAA